MRKFKSYINGPIIGGIIMFVLAGVGVFALGSISGYEAKQLIETSLSGLNMLCNTVTLASATILALLLTLLGVSTNSNSNLKKDHYQQVLKKAI